MRRLGLALALACALISEAEHVFAQAGPAQLRLTVMDQTGALLPGARVRISLPSGEPMNIQVNERGRATLTALPVGTVRLRVEYEGFVPYEDTVTLRGGNNNRTVTLKVAGLREEVVVKEEAADTHGGSAHTITLDEDDIAELSDDPDELQEQLDAMTGGAGAVFHVDGFRGGRLPNRDEIRQIRFRMNSYSADNHDAGRVQVQIITQPGLGRWSGNVNFGLRNDVLNARNAFARDQTREQFRRFTAGLRGPLVRNRTSLRFSIDGNRSFDSGTVYALLPDGRVADQVKRPYEQTNVTAGLQHGFTANQSFRLEYRNSDSLRRNLGVGDFNLADRAFTRSSAENQVRASLQSVIGRSTVNELRVQVNQRDDESFSASDAPAVVVIDAFSTGGAGVSSQGDTRTVQVGDDVDFTVGRHAMRAGLLLEAEDFTNADARNAAGTFTFSSLDAFLAGRPTTFTQRLGQARTSVFQYQLGLYWQDDVRVSRTLSIGFGVRQEVQNHVDDQANLMPRIGATLTAGRGTTIRGGYGTFHDWLGSDLYDQTQRVNGIAQTDLLILNPGYPNPIGGVAREVLPGGRVQLAPDLELPYVHQASIGIERTIREGLGVQASFTLMRGRNEFRSRNVNAPDEFGVRPEPGVGTVTQIESTGRSATNRLTMNVNYRHPSRRLFLNGNYTLSSVKNHADSATSLPANSLDPNAEWGPSARDVRHRFNAMATVTLPFDLRASLRANAQSAAPYTITTGRDDNRDGVSNDRPAGVGRNSTRGAARWELNLRLTRLFGFGGSREGAAGPGGGGPIERIPGGGPGLGPAGGPGVGPGGGTGLGPGGGGPVIVAGGGGDGQVFVGGGRAPDARSQRFSIELYAQAFNLLNRTNYLNFSGSLSSPFFQQPTSAAQARRLEIGMQFRF